MIFFSKTALHAVQAILYLSAQEPTRLVTAREIAHVLHLRVEATLKALNPLTRCGVIGSETGRNGGYQLTTPLEKITLLQVVEAVDGPIGSRDRSRSARTPTAGVLRDIAEELADHVRKDLAAKTVKDVARAMNRRAKKPTRRRH